jgi:hypothetical protein
MVHLTFTLYLSHVRQFPQYMTLIGEDALLPIDHLYLVEKIAEFLSTQYHKGYQKLLRRKCPKITK